jgi:hypothetical protein
VQEALFTIHFKAHPCYELGRFKSLVTLKMEAICSSEMSVLTTAIQHKVPEDIFHTSEQYTDTMKTQHINLNFKYSNSLHNFTFEVISLVTFGLKNITSEKNGS